MRKDTNNERSKETDLTIKTQREIDQTQRERDRPKEKELRVVQR